MYYYYKPGNVEIFHLAFKQFTEYLQVAVFQFLNSAEKISHFLAIDLRLNSSTTQHYSNTVLQTVQNRNFRLSLKYTTAHVALMKYGNYLTMVGTLYASTHFIVHLLTLWSWPLTFWLQNPISSSLCTADKSLVKIHQHIYCPVRSSFSSHYCFTTALCSACLVWIPYSWSHKYNTGIAQTAFQIWLQFTFNFLFWSHKILLWGSLWKCAQIQALSPWIVFFLCSSVRESAHTRSWSPVASLYWLFTQTVIYN